MKRRRDRERTRENYHSTSALGNPGNAEALARAVAISTVGPLTVREAKISVEIARLFSGRILDLEFTAAELAEQNEMLTVRFMEMIRLYG